MNRRNLIRSMMAIPFAGGLSGLLAEPTPVTVPSLVASDAWHTQRSFVSNPSYNGPTWASVQEAIKSERDPWSSPWELILLLSREATPKFVSSMPRMLVLLDSNYDVLRGTVDCFPLFVTIFGNETVNQLSLVRPSTESNPSIAIHDGWNEEGTRSGWVSDLHPKGRIPRRVGLLNNGVAFIEKYI